MNEFEGYLQASESMSPSEKTQEHISFVEGYLLDLNAPQRSFFQPQLDALLIDREVNDDQKEMTLLANLRELLSKLLIIDINNEYIDMMMRYSRPELERGGQDTAPYLQQLQAFTTNRDFKNHDAELRLESDLVDLQITISDALKDMRMQERFRETEAQLLELPGQQRAELLEELHAAESEYETNTLDAEEKLDAVEISLIEIQHKKSMELMNRWMKDFEKFFREDFSEGLNRMASEGNSHGVIPGLPTLKVSDEDYVKSVSNEGSVVVDRLGDGNYKLAIKNFVQMEITLPEGKAPPFMFRDMPVGSSRTENQDLGLNLMGDFAGDVGMSMQAVMRRPRSNQYQMEVGIASMILTPNQLDEIFLKGNKPENQPEWSSRAGETHDWVDYDTVGSFTGTVSNGGLTEEGQDKPRPIRKRLDDPTPKQLKQYMQKVERGEIAKVEVTFEGYDSIMVIKRTQGGELWMWGHFYHPDAPTLFNARAKNPKKAMKLYDRFTKRMRSFDPIQPALTEGEEPIEDEDQDQAI